MRYNSTINNVKAKEWGLTIQQAYLFSWMYELPSWASKVMIENDIYFFASKTKAVEELPILTEKTDTMYRYYKQLEDLDLIVIKKIDSKDYIKLTLKAIDWNFTSQSEYSDKNPNELGKLSENNSDLNPTYNIYNTNNNTNDKVSLDFLKLKIYFNQVYKKNTRVVSKEAKTNINQRIKEGYSKEDVQKVIDNASNDKHHIESDFKYITLEFLSRPKIFERYSSQPHQKPYYEAKAQGYTNH